MTMVQLMKILAIKEVASAENSIIKLLGTRPKSKRLKSGIGSWKAV